MMYRIRSVEVVRYPVVRVEFTDGFNGEYDLSPFIGAGPMFEPLKDEAFFRSAGVAKYGGAFGWRLNDAGNEIDFGADASRVHVETAAIGQLADAYRQRRTAAE